MTMKRSSKVLYFCIIWIVTISSISSEDVIVETTLGKIKGLKTQKTNTFLGVPYAQPPVGKLRWKSPEDPLAWKDNVYDATNFKPGCSQHGCESMNPPLVCPDKVSEDCLYLNIWAPLAANSTTSYPVLVYIHGGNFVHMSSTSLLFDGENLSHIGDIIVVTMDYRLGALGFLVTSDMPDGKGLDGNYGILDQRATLKWINTHIKSFGGDPQKVTLSGQSAGAQSTVLHLMTKDSAQYFQQALVESAPFSIPYKTREEAIVLGNVLAGRLNCRFGDLDCLENKTADEISLAQKDIRNLPTSLKLLEFFEPWGPVVDGKVVPFQPLVAIEKKMFVNMPIVIGTVTEETRIYVYSAWNKSLNQAEYAAELLALYPSHAIAALAEYPPSASSDQRDTLVQSMTDFVFTCCTRNYTRNVLTFPNSKVFRYEFNHAFSFPGWGPFKMCYNHVCHGSEIPFMFQSTALGNYTITADEFKLSNSIIYYWSNFVRNGDPNKGHPVNVAWPNYSSSSSWQYLLFETPSNSISSHYRTGYCDFWDNIGYNA